MSTSISQNSFIGGEWAPSLYGRFDLAKYPTAVRQMKNFYPHPHGGASNRGGTEFVDEIKDSTKKARLIPFQFSVVQSYILEFGDLYMRVIQDGGLVGGLDLSAPTYNWFLSGTGTNNYYLQLFGGGNPGLTDPDWVRENAVGASVGTAMARGTLGALTAGQFAYGDVDALGYDTIYIRMTIGGAPDTQAFGYITSSHPYVLATPYLEADIPLLKFAQSADVMYLAHPSYPLRKLSRLAHNNWTIDTVIFGAAVAAPTGLATTTPGGPNYRVTAVIDSGEESVVSGQVASANGGTLTWNAVPDIVYYNVYKDGASSGTFGWIGQANTPSFALPAGGIEPDYSRTPPVQDLDPFDSADNYPGVCTFFEQRLVLARTNNQPQTIWGSVVGAFENLNKSFPLRDDDSYEFTINSEQVNEIRWLVPLNSILVGTSGREWRMGAGGAGDAITPSSVNLKPQSTWGVSDTPPLVIGNAVLFLDGSRKRVRDLLFSLEQDGFTGSDLSILANHLFRNYEILEWAYQQHPDSILWCIRNDGALVGLTYYKEHEVAAWHQHETDGYFESVACIQTAAGVSEVYFIVLRTIDGVEKRYIEFFVDRLPPNASYVADVEDAWFVDSGLEYDGRNTDAAKFLTLSGGTTWLAGELVTMTATGHTPFSAPSVGRYYRLKSTAGNVIMLITAFTSSTVVTAKAVNREIPVELQGIADAEWALMVTVLSGLEHLEGKDVAILADGNVVSNQTVVAGAVTIPNPGSRVVIGLPYTSSIETLDFETATPNGTVQDKIREIVSVVFRLENTRALSVGPSEDRLTDLSFRESEYYGEHIEMFTGDKEAVTEAGDPREGRIFIQNTYPVPVTILALVVRMNYEDP